MTTSSTTVSPVVFRCRSQLESLVFDYLNGGHDPATFTNQYGVGSPLIQPLLDAASATADERSEHGLAAGIQVAQFAADRLCADADTLAAVVSPRTAVSTTTSAATSTTTSAG